MLSLFDGVSAGKKLFVITCNEIQSLSQYLINRPGRFHYHFRFLYPTADEIRAYMEDKLDKQYYDEIENVIAFSVRMNLNYDCLRSIAFELNTGSKFQEAINDLNIIRIDEYKEIKIVVEFENQATLTGEIGEDQLYDKTFTGMSVYLPDNIRPSSCIGVRVGDLPMDFSDNYIDNVSKYIENDFRNFRYLNTDNSIGGMIVCRSNLQAKKICEWFDKNSKLTTGLVMSDSDNPAQADIKIKLISVKMEHLICLLFIIC